MHFSESLCSLCVVYSWATQPSFLFLDWRLFRDLQMPLCTRIIMISVGPGAKLCTTFLSEMVQHKYDMMIVWIFQVVWPIQSIQAVVWFFVVYFNVVGVYYMVQSEKIRQCVHTWQNRCEYTINLCHYGHQNAIPLILKTLKYVCTNHGDQMFRHHTINTLMLFYWLNNKTNQGLNWWNGGL